MKYEEQYKKYKQLLCLLLISVLLWGSLPTEAIFAVEEGTVTYTTDTNSISGMLWVDMYENTANGIRSGDGIRQEGEPALSGYTVSLYKAEAKNNAVADIKTGADGKYEFTDLEPGSYVVGVVAGTIDGTEYVLPIVGITGDNKFGIWSGDYTRKYSDTIVIGADSIVTDINAGMRTPPGVQPMWSYENYELTGINNSGITSPLGTFHELNLVADYINNDTSSGNTEYIVTVGRDDLAVTAFHITRSNIKVTLTSSDSSTSPILTVADYIDWVAILLSGSSELTLNNIVLDGTNANASNPLAGIYVTNGTLTMEAGSIVRGFVKGYGGVYLANGKFVMEPGSGIIDNQGEWGHGGVTQVSGEFTMNGGTISGNTANGNGGGVYIDGGTFTMHGTSTISGNTANGNGGGVYINQGTFTMNTGLTGGITNNSAWSDSGGGVYLNGVDDFATLEMKAGFISNNRTGHGGGVYLATEYSKLNMTGGTIGNNEAQWGNGGGVHLKDGSFTIVGDGSAMSKNKAAGNGIGVYIDNGSLAMQSGMISENIPYTAGNSPWSSGGGVYLNGGTFTMDGNSEISENQAVYTGGGVCLTGGGLFEMKNGEIISNTLANAYNAGSGGGVYIKDSSTFTMKGGVIGKENAGNKADDGGGVYLAGKSSFKMTAGSIDRNEAIYGGGVNINSEIGDGTSTYAPSTFTMSGGTIGGEDSDSGNTAYDGGGVFIASGCSFKDTSTNPTEAKITFNKATMTGGGIYVLYNNSNGLSEGQFEISNVKISDNKAEGDFGGGIAFVVESIGTTALPVTMIGGTVKSNEAVSGGGIGLVNNSDKKLFLKIENVSIEGNAATKLGGGVNVIGDLELTMNHCIINDNKADEIGGGIYCGEQSSLVMQGGEITKNSGGGAYFLSKIPIKIALTGVTISENERWEGGGLRIDANTTDSIISGCTISNNTAQDRGGGIFFQGQGIPSTITIEETEIINNHAKPSWTEVRGIGGGVYITNSNSLVMNGGEISSNDAYGRHNDVSSTDGLGGGGGVYVDGSATFTINSGSINNNTAANGDGGGIYTVAEGTVNAESGAISITGNTAPSGNGGGIYTGSAGPEPGGYGNLNVAETVTFSNNTASASYNPLNANVLPFSEYWKTITNYTYTAAVNPIYATSNRLVAVNNFDINYESILGSITIKKEGTDGLLDEAEFKLERLDSAGEVIGDPFTGTTGEDGDGTVRFPDLEPGKYLITETKAPTGYSLLAKSFTVTIPMESTIAPEDGYSGEVQEVNGKYYYFDPILTVTNQVAFTLPAAGSEGFLSQYYLWIGLMILLAAGGSYAYRQRRRRSCGQQN